MLLTEIDHVAIAVKDLEAAIDYYQRAFGATVDHRRSWSPTGWRKRC
ncbi:MAG: VOC family protein [Acidimicrobiales bacterium]